MTKILRWLLPVVFALSATVSTNAETWPDRPIKFISSQAAGGGTDIIGRLVADQLSARVGQPIVYENRPGRRQCHRHAGSGALGAGWLHFFFATAAALVTDPYTFKSLPYDPMTAFVQCRAWPRCRSSCWPIRACRQVAARTDRTTPRPSRTSSPSRPRASGAFPAWWCLAQQASRHQDFLCALHFDGPGIQDAIAGRVPLIIIVASPKPPHRWRAASFARSR